MGKKPIYAQLARRDEEPITDDAGNVIAWGSHVCAGPNVNCRRAYRGNRPYHIIPAHTDPRAQNCHLVLPTFHATDRAEALEMLQKGWETAETVDNARDRDDAYKRGVPVKILKSGKYV